MWSQCRAKCTKCGPWPIRNDVISGGLVTVTQLLHLGPRWCRVSYRGQVPWRFRASVLRHKFRGHLQYQTSLVVDLLHRTYNRCGQLTRPIVFICAYCWFVIDRRISWSLNGDVFRFFMISSLFSLYYNSYHYL